jgi:hypothetical protein
VTFPEVHLAGEAVAAFVDGELAPVAHARALAHLDVCAECRGAVHAQQEVADLLAGAPEPALPAALVARLRDIPMTADLGNADVVIAVEGDDLVWATPSSLRARARAAVVPQLARPGPARSARPPQPGTGDRRQASAPPSRPPGRPRRVRRVLAGAVAGIALGVFAATAPTSVSGVGVAPDRGDRGVNGGVVDPPTFGEVGLREIQSGLDEGRFGGVVRFGSRDGGAPPDRAGAVSASRGQERVLWRGALLDAGAGRSGGPVRGAMR